MKSLRRKYFLWWKLRTIRPAAAPDTDERLV
jgi:hypothetical protein